ncbi:MAG: hypothetical protein GVY36_12690 [Verrucomicrobia bacterium]|jgi:hypothetical protein|nr:hypothetical protein [Verrucomicrobiota bacterium]
MNSDALRQSLRRPYDRENWTELMRSVFGSHVRLNAEAQQLPTDDESIKSIAQIGDVLLDDGKQLAVIEVEVGDDINLLRNRVSLRNRVAKFIDQDRAHGVLAVFSSGSPEYRFSFTARETLFDEELGMVEKETATKRFTYVLGPGETCNTAAARFERLGSKSESIRMDDIVEAFSVEKLNKEFFNTYKEHYQLFCNHLLSEAKRAQTYQLFGIRKVSNATEQTRLEKPVRDFVKRLLGRIVFLHFLQKKGWMGCPPDRSDWTGGDLDFLRNYFEQTLDKDRFHSERLLPLFYEALNHPHRPEAIFEPTGTRIPYLNGGLFEKMIERESAIDFPVGHFGDLLEFFGQYNFTIDENDPDEHEVGIDPEMLGHIFENLLEDNKDKGAYYTPKAIVHYMCQQSLIYYLLRHLGQSDEAEAAVTYLVRHKQIGEGTPHAKFIKSHAAKIEELIDAVKVCDPAIGSGAFPIGLLQEIFWLKLTLDMTLNQPEQLAGIKRGVLQNSIYGVDKDAGAVDIARLRFWLALVVDEAEPSPLPNLDYKIMQGDSLLESFEGVPLDNLMDAGGTGGVTIASNLQAEMDFASGQMQLTAEEKADKITQLMRDYYAAESPEKKESIHQQIDAFVRYHIEYNLAVAEEAFETELHQHRANIADKQKQLPSWTPAKKVERRMAWLEKSIAELGEKKKRLEKLEHEAERPYFLWHLYFKDVFEKGGFDIVIANPPYVRQEVIKDYKPLLENEGYECFKGTADLFVYFYERSVKMLNPQGVLTYITSNKYYRSGYGEKLRSFLAKELTLHEMLDFGDAPVFDAIAYASILIGTKEPPAKTHSLKAWTWQRGEKIGQVATVMSEKAFPMDQANLTPDGWRLERPEVFALLKKLKSKGTPLGEYVDGRFYYGIKTGLNEAFVVDRATRDRLIAEDPKSNEVLKPYLRGKDLKRWKTQSDDLWLLYIPWHFPDHLDGSKKGVSTTAENKFKKKFPAIYEHLNGFKQQLCARNKAETGIRYEWYALQRWGADYWKEWESPKIILGRFMNKPLYAYDDKNFYHNNALSFIAGASRTLVAILNCNVSWWFLSTICTDLQNGYIQAHNANQEPIPIPAASKKDKEKLEKLAKKAGQSEGPALAAIEDEINQIVYRLFDLTDEEIQLIERTINKKSEAVIPGEHGKTSNKNDFFRRLREVAAEHPYIPFDRLKQVAHQNKLTENDDTLYDYLGQAVEAKILHHAGRGWYTRNEKKARLDDATIRELKDSLGKRFPLLPHYLWSPLQFNPWLHHQLGQAPTFVYVDADGIDDVAEFLRGNGWEVANNPGKNDPGLSNPKRGVVLREVRREINEDEPSIETALVDLLMENKRFQFMDDAEYREMLHKLLDKQRIDLARLLRLIGDRKRKLTEILSEESTQYLGIV